MKRINLVLDTKLNNLKSQLLDCCKSQVVFVATSNSDLIPWISKRIHLSNLFLLAKTKISFNNFIYLVNKHQICIALFVKQKNKNETFTLSFVSFHTQTSIDFTIDFKNLFIFWKSMITNLNNLKNNSNILKLQSDIFEIKKYSNLFITTTDTVVGLGVFIKKKETANLMAIKQRPIEKQFLILASHLKQIKPYIKTSSYLKLKRISNQFWPGANTLILEAKGDQTTLGFRIPNCQKLIKKLEKYGPAYVTSANISGQPSLTFVEAKSKFWQVNNFWNLCTPSGKASKIIDVSTGKIFRK